MKAAKDILNVYFEYVKPHPRQIVASLTKSQMKFIEQAAEILLTPKSVTQPRTPQTGPYQHHERDLLILARLATLACSMSVTCILGGWLLSPPNMFTSTIIEDRVLLTVTLIDAALLGILLLISLRAHAPVLTLCLSFLSIVAVLLFVLFFKQILDISIPIIEQFWKSPTPILGRT